jgi:ferritin-like metal-binding protein YciE
MYWASKARSAASTVGPKPAIPSRTFRPSNATQTPERAKSRGRRTAEGLPGCARKYNSARSFTAVLSIYFSLIFKETEDTAQSDLFLPQGQRRNFNSQYARLFCPFRIFFRGGVLNAPSKQGNQKKKGHMKLDTLKKLFLNELRDLYHAEGQLLKALPKMAEAASSEELKNAFETHLKETEGHVERLEEVFELLEEETKGKVCHGMKGLIEEGSEILEEDGEDSVLDAGIIVAAQKVEHYEIASYGSVRTFAELLGQSEAVELLQATLDEESAANELLNKLAQDIVNPEALMESEVSSASAGR